MWETGNPSGGIDSNVPIGESIRRAEKAANKVIESASALEAPDQESIEKINLDIAEFFNLSQSLLPLNEDNDVQNRMSKLKIEVDTRLRSTAKRLGLKYAAKEDRSIKTLQALSVTKAPSTSQSVAAQPHEANRPQTALFGSSSTDAGRYFAATVDMLMNKSRFSTEEEVERALSEYKGDRRLRGIDEDGDLSAIIRAKVEYDATIAAWLKGIQQLQNVSSLMPEAEKAELQRLEKEWPAMMLGRYMELNKTAMYRGMTFHNPQEVLEKFEKINEEDGINPPSGSRINYISAVKFVSLAYTSILGNYGVLVTIEPKKLNIEFPLATDPTNTKLQEDAELHTPFIPKSAITKTELYSTNNLQHIPRKIGEFSGFPDTAQIKELLERQAQVR